MKVCFPTSSGGHLAQLWRLKPWWSAHDRFWVSFDKPDCNSLLAKERLYHCHYPTNRNIPNLIRNTVIAIRVLRKERPDLIVSTGAAIAVPFFYVGKMLGAKCVYIEVFDRIDKPTLTGKLVRKASDVFVVQWSEMLSVYPGAINLGSIF